MVNKEFNVHIEDMDGNIILNKTLKSQVNGFIDLWLPRNKKFLVKIEQQGKEAKAELSTFEGDKTCITTMQLK